MSWKYSAINAANQISLHDRIITAASWIDDSLTLTFENGFILTLFSEQNTLGRPAQTGCSEILFSHCTDYSLRILTTRELTIFGITIPLGKYWYELTEEQTERFSAFIAKHRPAIITDYHNSSHTEHHYTCFAHSLNRYHGFLTLARLNGQKRWRLFFGSKSYDRFEQEHWNDEYDIKEISMSSISHVSLSVSSDSQNHNIIYHWNEYFPYD